MAKAPNERSPAPGTSTGSINIRRSDYDITNTVRVSSALAVLQAIEQLFAATWPGTSSAPLRQAITQFDDMFSGRAPGYASWLETMRRTRPRWRRRECRPRVRRR